MIKNTWTKYAIASAALMAVSSCTELAYYHQAINGQWRLLEQRQPVTSLLEDNNTSGQLRERLDIARQLRDFASKELALPDNGSYRSYADLGRPFVVYNVFAASKLSLQAKSWCFPVLGCVSYRGYFDVAEALQLAKQLRQQDYDVFVANIPAYSTLGWFDDPLLNTFMHWPHGRIAELMFHELAHQQLYIADDTVFNESFATAVGQLGAELWLQDKPVEQQAYQRFRERRKEFMELINKTKNALTKLYASEQSPEAKYQHKQHLFNELQARYQRIKNQRWDGFSGYDDWFEKDLNNAKLSAVAIYTQYVPAFLALFDGVNNDFPVFYQAVQALAELPKEQRQQRLNALNAD